MLSAWNLWPVAGILCTVGPAVAVNVSWCHLWVGGRAQVPSGRTKAGPDILWLSWFTACTMAGCTSPAKDWPPLVKWGVYKQQAEDLRGRDRVIPQWLTAAVPFCPGHQASLVPSNSTNPEQRRSPDLWEKKMPLRRKRCGLWPVAFSIRFISSLSILVLPNWTAKNTGDDILRCQRT